MRLKLVLSSLILVLSLAVSVKPSSAAHSPLTPHNATLFSHARGVQPELQFDLDWIPIPAGEFVMGSSDDEIAWAVEECNVSEGNCQAAWFAAEKPQRTDYTDAFEITYTEVTNGQYNRCVEAGVCRPAGVEITDDNIHYDPGYFADEYPVVGVNLVDAGEFCRWIDARLPTEPEWEKAARGIDGRRYPWGDPLDTDLANLWRGYPTPVGAFPGGASPYGVMDMAGNVFEWTATTADGGYVLKGGSWFSYPFRGRSADRGTVLPAEFANYDIGFRCVREPQPAAITPDLVLPDIVAPDVLTPGIIAPGISMPDAIAPGALAPGVVVPEFITPESTPLEDADADLSYPPFDGRCTARTIRMLAVEYEESEFARLALTACGPKAIGALTALADDPDNRQRCRAAAALAAMEDDAADAAPVLNRIFRDDACAGAYHGLAALGEAAVPYLIDALLDEHSDLWVGAAIGLGTIGRNAGDAVPVLSERLYSDESDWVLDIMAEALGDIGTDGEFAVQALMDLYMRTGSVKALSALGSFGSDAEEAIPLLLDALYDPATAQEADHAIGDALGRIGPAAVPALEEALKHENMDVRAAAAHGLILLGRRAAPAENALWQALKEESPSSWAGERMAVALVQVDQAYSEFLLPELISLVQRHGYYLDDVARARAADRLGEMGVNAAQALPALTDMADQSCTSSTDESLCLSAIEALAEIGGALREIVAEENQHMDSSDWHDLLDEELHEALVQAEMTLAKILNAERRPWTTKTRTAAAAALGELGQGDTAGPQLIHALGDRQEEVRRQALRSLTALDVDVDLLIPELMAALADPDDGVVQRSALALATIGRSTIPRLLEALESDDSARQRGAAYALGNLGTHTRSVITALEELTWNEEADFEARRVAAAALDSLDADGEEFFDTFDLIPPSAAVCPAIAVSPNTAYFEYNPLTDRCEFYWQTGFTGAGQRVIEILCNIFGC